MAGNAAIRMQRWETGQSFLRKLKSTELSGMSLTRKGSQTIMTNSVSQGYFWLTPCTLSINTEENSGAVAGQWGFGAVGCTFGLLTLVKVPWRTEWLPGSVAKHSAKIYLAPQIFEYRKWQGTGRGTQWVKSIAWGLQFGSPAPKRPAWNVSSLYGNRRLPQATHYQ